VCDKCDIVFLLATETTENIEGQANPTICEEIQEGIYCDKCISQLSTERRNQ